MTIAHASHAYKNNEDNWMVYNYPQKPLSFKVSKA